MPTSSDRRNPVEVLAEEFLDRKRRGETPTLREYLERYPDLAEEIRDLFPALLMMEDLGDDSGGTTGSLAGDGAVAVARPAPEAGRLPHPAGDRPGRHGGRLRGRAGVARPPRGPEGPVGRRPDRPPAGPPVRARGQGGGAAAPHQHRAGLRRGPAGRAPLLRHAVHRRAGAGPGPGGPAPAAALQAGPEPAARRPATSPPSGRRRPAGPGSRRPTWPGR